MTTLMKIEKEKKNYIGSSLDDFLKEEDIFEEVTELAVKQVIAWQIEQEMKNQGLTRVAVAAKMHTSRAALDRCLDPQNTSVTLKTLVRIALAIGKKVQIQFV